MRLSVSARRAAFLATGLLAVSLVHAQTGERVWGYKVKPGDRLVDIAKTYQKNPNDWKKLQESNAVPDPKRLVPGKQIRIPVTDLKQGDPVAEAVLVHGDVFRLDKAGQPGAKLASGDVLKMGDMVQTGARSTLTIRFADASRMLVTEKSKVSLDSLLNYGKTGMADTKVQVHAGGTDSQVSPQKGVASRYEINTPAINLTVRGTGFRVQVEGESGATRTEVEEGQVAGSAEGGGQALIGNGFGIVAEPGKPLGKPSQLLAAPVLATAAQRVEKFPLRFSWQALEGAQKYRLQLLASVGGSDAIVVDEYVSTTEAQWDDLPDGDYALRVRGVDAVGLEGSNAVKAFTLKTRPEPPLLSYPLHLFKAEDEKIFFRWEVAPAAHTYVFQVAQDSEFKNVIARVPGISADTRGVLLALPPGRYYWRVASVTEGGDMGPFGVVFSFEQTRANP